MSVLLKCPSQHHTVRLDPNRFWQTAICPKCKVPIDPTRLRRIMARLSLLFPNSTKAGVPQSSRAVWGGKGEGHVSPPTSEKTDKPYTSSSKQSIATRERMFGILNFIKSKGLLGLKDFLEDDANSFEIKTPYAEYGHRTWLTYERNNDGSAVRIELAHIFGSLDFDKGVNPNHLLRLLSTNIPSFQNSSAYIGVKDMDGTHFVSLNSTLIFLTKWSDEDIADALSILLFDLVTGLALEPPPPIKQFDAK